HRLLEGRAGEVLLYGDEAGGPYPLDVRPPDQVPGPLRRHHVDVDVLGGYDLGEVDVEAVREAEGVPLLQVRLDIFLVNYRVNLVGKEDLDHLRLLRRLRRRRHPDPVRLRPLPGPRSRDVRRDDLEPRVLEVLGLGVPLASVSYDGDRLPLQNAQVGVPVVVYLCHFLSPPYLEKSSSENPL